MLEYWKWKQLVVRNDFIGFFIEMFSGVFLKLLVRHKLAVRKKD